MTGTKLKLQVTVGDISRARCGNRRQCVLAQAIDRQFGLAGKGYVRVDASHAAYTKDGKRHRYHLSSKAVLYLRRFDVVGETKGEAEARRAINPQKFDMQLLDTKPIPPPADRKRKDQINKRRNTVRALERAKGILPTTYKRYTGLSPITK